jgi:hypothetical protein
MRARDVFGRCSSSFVSPRASNSIEIAIVNMAAPRLHRSRPGNKLSMECIFIVRVSTLAIASASCVRVTKIQIRLGGEAIGRADPRESPSHMELTR